MLIYKQLENNYFWLEVIVASITDIFYRTGKNAIGQLDHIQAYFAKFTDTTIAFISTMLHYAINEYKNGTKEMYKFYSTAA